MAKIVEVRASAHSCPFESNFVRLGLGTNTKRDIVLVRITDESGAVGLGEAHHGQNPTAMATVIQDGLGSLIIGIADTYGQVLVPELARVTIYALMALILIFKPAGLVPVRSGH